MEIIQGNCGRKYRVLEKKQESLPDLHGIGVSQDYFIDDEQGNPVKVGLNEFLQDFITGRMSEIGEEIIAGRALTRKDISDKVISGLSALSKQISDPGFKAKHLLLGFFLSNLYADSVDNILDDVYAFESFESELYEGVTNLLKVKNGS